MTYKIYGEDGLDEILGRLLAPQRLYSAAEIEADSTLVTPSAGAYGWWFDWIPPGVSAEGVKAESGRHLLYVGIAGGGAAKAKRPRTLRQRLANHIKGRVAQSTLRRTLACLLEGALGLKREWRTAPSGRVKMALAGDGEDILTDWMRTHAYVAWAPHPRPRLVEKTMLADVWRLPLNIEGSRDTFALTLRNLRRRPALDPGFSAERRRQDGNAR